LILVRPSILSRCRPSGTDALEKAKANRTVFAQRRIRPDEVLPEWQKQQDSTGHSSADVQRFVQSACARLGNAPLETGRAAATPAACRSTCPKHCASAGRRRVPESPPAPQPAGAGLRRAAPQPPAGHVLAEHLLESPACPDVIQALRRTLRRHLTDAVEVVTTVYLLRLRHQLGYVRRRQPFQMMAEETVALAVAGRSKPEWLRRRARGQTAGMHAQRQPAAGGHAREMAQALDFLRPTPAPASPGPRARRSPAGRPPPRARSRPRRGPIQREPLPAGGRDGRVRAAARFAANCSHQYCGYET
jgi:hypothetical protein